MSQFRWITVCLIILFGLTACTVPAETVQVTRPAAQTETAVPAITHSPETEPATEPTDESATPEPTLQPTPLPTAEAVVEWLTYQNDFYGYTINYPPDAQIATEGVSGFPTEELPENMTATEYRNQLKEMYPGDICVSISLNAGSVHILAPEENGGKYATPCPGLGIGAYTMTAAGESIIINGRSYTASGNKIHEQDETATFHSEFYSVHLEDGTTITTIAGPEFSSQFETDYEAAFADYQATKEMLRQIMASFRSFAPAEGYQIPDEPVFVGGEVRLAGWSPDGRYLAYFESTQEQVEAASPGPPGSAEGSFVIYNTATGEKCRDYVLDAFYPNEGPGLGRRYLWLPGSGDLLILTPDGRLWQASAPCEEAEELTAVFPETIRYLHSFSPDQSLLLMAGETHYWFYDSNSQTAVQIPEVVPDMMNNLIWSPDGTYLAITLAGNYTGDRDPIGGSRVVEVASGQIIARHDWEPANALDGTFGGPVWLGEETFVVTLSLDQGPFFMTVTGEVEPALPLFGDLPEGNIKQLFVYVEPDSGHYHLLLKEWSGEQPPAQPRIYHSESGNVELLALQGPDDPWLTADGRIMIYGENGGYWSRPVTAVGQPLTVDETQACIRPWDPSKGSISIIEGKLFKVSEGCRFLTAVIPPDMSGFLYGSASPNDQWLAVISQTNALYVVPLDFLE